MSGMTFSGFGVPPIASKQAHFVGLSALLDPAAYVYYGYVGGFDVTVPAGECWYVLSAWNVMGPNTTGSSSLLKGRWFHRDPSHPCVAPAGTRLRTYDYGGVGAEDGYLYVCKPLLVSSGARYLQAESLYYERLERLKTLSLSRISASIQAGDPHGTTASESLGTGPKIMITQISLHDGCWADLCKAGGNTMNLFHEISDTHQWRYGHGLLLPVNISDFTHLRVENASVSGATGDAHIEALGGCGYHVLPSDW